MENKSSRWNPRREDRPTKLEPFERRSPMGDIALFNGAISYEEVSEVMIVGGIKVLRVRPILLHGLRIKLETGELVRRVSDGAWFRITGEQRDIGYSLEWDICRGMFVERCENQEWQGGVNDEV